MLKNTEDRLLEWRSFAHEMLKNTEDRLSEWRNFACGMLTNTADRRSKRTQRFCNRFWRFDALHPRWFHAKMGPVYSNRPFSNETLSEQKLPKQHSHFGYVPEGRTDNYDSTFFYSTRFTRGIARSWSRS